VRRYQVHLTGPLAHCGETPPTLSARERRALARQYRAYLASPQWLPEEPSVVCLSGRQGRPVKRDIRKDDEYELSLLTVSRPEPRLKRLLVAAAAAAAVVVPASARSAAAETRRDAGAASAQPEGRTPPASRPYDCGPPTSRLSTSAPRAQQSLEPLRDKRGQPVELGAYHTNTVPHTNNFTAHTNTPPHTNVWQNHSNIPTFTVPHTNVVPGDFIF